MVTDRFPIRNLLRLLEEGLERFVFLTRAVAFWATIVFPVCYGIGYAAVVLDPALSVPPGEVLVAVLAANLLAVVLGQGYRGDRNATPSKTPEGTTQAASGD